MDRPVPVLLTHRGGDAQPFGARRLERDRQGGPGRPQVGGDRQRPQPAASDLAPGPRTGRDLAEVAARNVARTVRQIELDPLQLPLPTEIEREGDAGLLGTALPAAAASTVQGQAGLLATEEVRKAYD